MPNREQVEVMFDLEGRVAIVTGGAQGIGRAIALNLAEGGASIVLTDTQRPKLDEVAKEIEDKGGKAIGFCVDVTDLEAIQAMVGQTLEAWGKVDILVNNAGITRDNLVMRMKKDDWEAVLKTNLSGAFYCIRGGFAQHGPPALRAHHQHCVGCRSGGQRWAGKLHFLEGGNYRIDQSRGGGGGAPQHHGQCGCAGLYCHSDDREPASRGQGEDVEPYPYGTHGNGRRDRDWGAVPGLGGSSVYYRARPQY